MNLKSASGWILLTLLSISPFFSSAQSYTISPGTNVSTIVPMNDWGELKIDMENLLGHDLDLYWETLVWNIPAEWTITFCDYAGCWSDSLIPLFRRMDPIPPAVHGFIKINVNALVNPGPGHIEIRLSQIGDSTNFQLLTFDFNTSVSVDEVLSNEISIFPNPANQQLRIDNISTEIQQSTIIVRGLDGRTLKTEQLGQTSQYQISTSDLSNGMYFLEIQNENKTARKSFVIAR